MARLASGEDVEVQATTTDAGDFRQTYPDLAPPAPVLLAPPIVTPTVAVAPTGGRGLVLEANGTLSPTVAATAIQMLNSDPISPRTGQVWYRTDTDKLSVQTATGVKRSAAFI